MTLHRSASLVLVLAWLALALGCGGSSAPSVPDTPDGTVKAVSQGLAGNQPQVIWAAAPASYQKDLNEVVHLFASKMDAEVWNRSVSTTRKVVSLLQAKKGMVLGSKMLAQMDMADMKKVDAEWDNVVGILETALDSDLASLDKMKNMNVGDFLADTGARLMAQVEAAAGAAKGNPFQNEFKSQFENVQVKIVSQEGDKATLEVTTKGEPAKKTDWMKVEGKWVPEEIARDWTRDMGKVKKQIEAMSTEFSDNDKKKFVGMLDMVDKTIAELGAAKDQGEFDAALGEVMGGLMGGMMGGPAPAGFKVPK